MPNGDGGNGGATATDWTPAVSQEQYNKTYSCIVAPLFTWASALLGHPTEFPKLDDPLLQATLAGMLGLGHITRTVEKIQGVVGQH